MKTKTKQTIYTTLIGILSLSLILFSYNKYLSKKASQVGSELIKVGSNMISLMLETGVNTGEYTESTSNRWPGKGYVFNETLSKCENGSILTYNSENNSVSVKTNKTDRCFIYFDVEPPDVYVAVNNVPTTYGKAGTLSCSSNGATYNEQYNRIEVSSVNTKYENCTLNFTDRTSKTYLNNYITSLAGATQGTGEVVEELYGVPDWNTALPILESDYTNVGMYRSDYRYVNDYAYSMSGLYNFTNNEWVLNTSLMTDFPYFIFEFKPRESGYYQICYEFSKGEGNLALENGSFFSYIANASSNKSVSGCYELGYLSSSNYISLFSGNFSSPATLSFNVEKATDVSDINTNVRYEGKNPNNYIWFNNELWRIIGVFDSASHGQSGKNLVKIIRNDSIGALGWDKTNINNWEASSLKSLLNGAYYNAQDGTSTDYCYESSSVKLNCDYRKIGMQTGYRRMIQNVTWYLGGSSSQYISPADFYKYERGTTVYSGRPTSTTGYIGLMYPSDYGYSALLTNCARFTKVGYYSSLDCAGQSWLYGEGHEWMLAPNSTYNNKVFYLMSGEIYYGDIGYKYVVRPTLYLKDSVYYVDGDGSLLDPYIIGM